MDEHDALARIPILTEKLVLLLPVASRWNPSTNSLADLVRELPMIRYSSRSTTGAMVERYLRVARVPAGRRIEVDNADMMCTLVAEGVGCALTTPLHILQGQSRMQGIAVRKLLSRVPERQVTLVTRDGEWSDVASRLAVEARRLLTEKHLPHLLKLQPDLASEICLAQS